MKNHCKRIGLLGGSFDPIHNGHLHMAKAAYSQFSLDEVWLIPNGKAPHKDGDKMADGEHRLAMCQLVASEYPFLQASDVEIRSKEYSYTYLTMQKLTAEHPEYEFYFILGADSLDYFERWRNPEIIASLCKILVVNRDEFTVDDLKEKILHINQLFPADIEVIHCTKYDVSSTEIRSGKKLEDVSSLVKEYILEHHLYGL